MVTSRPLPAAHTPPKTSTLREPPCASAHPDERVALEDRCGRPQTPGPYVSATATRAIVVSDW